MTTKGRTHLTDDRLVEVCFDGAPTPGENDHLHTCDTCRTRQSHLDALLREVADAATALSDAVFTPERLAVQRARILQRIVQDGRQGRVIAFPASLPAETRLFRARPVARWTAAAAAAGFAVGLLVGRLTHEGPSSRALRAAVPRGVSARLEPVSTFAPLALTVSDDEFLGQIENSLDGPASVLRPLHDLTPLADQILISTP